MSVSKRKFIKARRSSRFLIIQALYEWQLSGSSVESILRDFAMKRNFADADSEYFHELLQNITAGHQELTEVMRPFLDRPIDQIDPVEKGVLWLGIYELKNKPELPYKVVINEALELAKQFGSEGSHRYINSILDKVQKSLK